MDTEGRLQQYLFPISGIFTVSRDGKFLISGCEDGLSLCKYEISRINFENHFDRNYNPVKEFSFGEPVLMYEVPKECVNLFSSSPDATDFIPHSISLSRDDKKIAIVCQNIDEESRVCILDIENGYLCWNNDMDVQSVN